MSELQHTPGPWHFTEEDVQKEEHPRLVNAAGEQVCDFGCWTQYYPNDGTPPSEPDMRLISAAPDLLKALKQCWNAIGGGTVINDKRGTVYEQQFGQAFLNYLETEITKAEGGA